MAGRETYDVVAASSCLPARCIIQAFDSSRYSVLQSNRPPVFFTSVGSARCRGIIRDFVVATFF